MKPNVRFTNVLDGTTMVIGPMRRDFVGSKTPGDCRECGGQCAPKCGSHPKGCVYGGATVETAFWLYAEDCELWHGQWVASEAPVTGSDVKRHAPRGSVGVTRDGRMVTSSLTAMPVNPAAMADVATWLEDMAGKRDEHFTPEVLERVANRAATLLAERGGLTVAALTDALAAEGCAYAALKALMVLSALVAVGRAIRRGDVFLAPGSGEA